MANVLSEPDLPNGASMEEEIHLERTSVPLDPLVLAAKAAAEADPSDPELWVKYGRALRRQQMQDRHGGDAFSAAAFSDDTQCFAFSQDKIDPIYCRDLTFAVLKICLQPADFQQNFIIFHGEPPSRIVE